MYSICLLDLGLITIHIWNFQNFESMSNKGKAKFTLCSLSLKNLKSAMILFKLGFFLAISIIGEEYGDMSFSKVPKCINLYISFSIIGLSSNLTQNGIMKNGDLSMTCKSSSIFGQVSISSLGLKTSLYFIQINSTFSNMPICHLCSQAICF